jgi:hypothetical protein
LRGNQENYNSQQDMWNVPLISLFGEMSMEESESEIERERLIEFGCNSVRDRQEHKLRMEREREQGILKGEVSLYH